MIQVTVNNQSFTGFSYGGYIRINLGDAMTVTPTFTNILLDGNIYYALTYPYLLYKLKSQQTGKIKVFTKTGLSPAVGVNINTFKRWVVSSFRYSVNPLSTEDLSANELKVGNSDFPLGFYDLTIYQSEIDGDLNPDNATATLYTGLLNFKGNTINDSI